MNQLGGFPLLTLIVFLPVLGAVLSLFVRRERREALHWLALLISVSDLFITLFLYMGWEDDPLGGTQFVDGPWTWIAGLGASYHLGVDGINLHLVLLAALLPPLLMLSLWLREGETQRTKESVFWTLLFEGGLLGALTALDVFLLSAFWLLAILAAFFLIGQGAHSFQAAAQFVPAAALVAVALLAITLGVSTAASRSGLASPVNAGLPQPTQTWMFWAAAVACGITGAIFPLHLWYPATQQQASPVTRVLVGSLLLNLGGYGLIRLCLSLLPLAAIRFAPAMMVMGTLGLLYGGLAGLGQRTVSGALAYWRVAQMGLTTVGIFSMADLGLYGAIMHVAGSSLAAAALLLLCVEQREGQRQVSSAVPVSWARRTALSLGFLSAMGTPGLVGFTGQGLLVLGAARWPWQGGGSAATNGLWDWLWRGLIAGGVLLGMWALLRAWRRAVPISACQPARHTLIVLPLLFLIVLAGIAPTLTSRISGPSIHRLLVQLRQGIERDRTPELPPEPPEEKEKEPVALEIGNSTARLSTVHQGALTPRAARECVGGPLAIYAAPARPGCAGREAGL